MLKSLSKIGFDMNRVFELRLVLAPAWAQPFTQISYQPPFSKQPLQIFHSTDSLNFDDDDDEGSNCLQYGNYIICIFIILHRVKALLQEWSVL